MKKEVIKINNIPTIIWGDASEYAYLYVHGKLGCKEEAEKFAEIANETGWQVISIDLPGYGERSAEIDHFNPWHVVPELKEVMEYIRVRWSKVSLYASSIGAWFSMLSFSNEEFEQCMFLSPILDMYHLISNMIQWAGITEDVLKEKKAVETSFGETLYWDYYQYAKAHPITQWKPDTHILYGTKDNLTEYEVVKAFTTRFHCNLTVLEGGEHWFHTKQQLEVLEDWMQQKTNRSIKKNATYEI